MAKWTEEWNTFCAAFLGQMSSSHHNAPSVRTLHPDLVVLRARDYLNAYWNQSVTLEDLARETSMSTWEICRRFSAAFGLAPHRYQLLIRLREAKTRLLNGACIADVAIDTGFCDQSHLGRHFRSVFGLTPGTLVKQAAKTRTF
ncbi:helix-turn-helix domain-containing protein [Cupriavidus basilensis]